jgi:hypothetical protein
LSSDGESASGSDADDTGNSLARRNLPMSVQAEKEICIYYGKGVHRPYQSGGCMCKECKAAREAARADADDPAPSAGKRARSGAGKGTGAGEGAGRG